MTSDPDFLSVEEVLELHRLQLDRFGGGTGIRDRPGLESAVAQPQAGFGGTFVHPDLFLMAAAYAFHIAQNQPFVDGNKRTGLAAALVFLDMNGYSVSDPDEKLYDALIAIANKQLDKAGLAKILREQARAHGA